MNLLRSLLDWGHTARIATLADEVARRSRPHVWNAVRQRINQLTHNEARGYVRARAGEIIRQTAEQALESSGESALHLNELIENSFESSIRLVLTESRTVRIESAVERNAA
ncbi:MAG: hypothetical protein NXI22_11925 [bacterium]|nr:hypothetical protein [bacterium]